MESKDSKTAKKTMKMNSEGRFISDNPKCYKNTVKIMVLEQEQTSKINGTNKESKNRSHIS